MFVVPAGVLVALLFGYPIVKNVLMSFQDYSLRTFFTGEAPWVAGRNYATVTADHVFPTEIANTALFTLGSILGQFVIGMLLALYFKRNFPLSGVLRALMLLPWLIPLIAGSAVWRAILDQDSGILNSLLKGLHLINSPIPWLASPQTALSAVIIVNVWLGIPFNMTLLHSGLQGIPDELYEAAALDGASPWQSFWSVTWPSLRPVVSVVLTLGVVYTLKALDIILGLTHGGPADSTQTIATRSYGY
jgi:multiple sugar transport system permease protein